MINQEDLEKFIFKMEKLKNIDDIELIKEQLNKAIIYYKTKILNEEKYERNELIRCIFSLSQNKNLSNKEDYFDLYKEIKIKNLSKDEILDKFLNMK
jgi:hypothetical protein